MQQKVKHIRFLGTFFSSPWKVIFKHFPRKIANFQIRLKNQALFKTAIKFKQFTRSVGTMKKHPPSPQKGFQNRGAGCRSADNPHLPKLSASWWVTFSGCLRPWLRPWTMCSQPGHHVVIMVSEQGWKYRWAVYKTFHAAGKFNVQYLWFLRTKSLQILQQ